METRVTEVADGVHQLTTHIPEIDFGLNQYLVAADEPLLFHTGLRGFFPLVSAGIAGVLPVETLRWVSFGHVEADECGAMNEFLAVAPGATVAQGMIGCMVSINDLADRPPEPMAPDAVYDLGGKVIRNVDTPHVPHGWDAHVLFEETTGTLLCGDLLSQVGDGPPLSTGDVLEAAAQAEDLFGATCLTPHTAPTIRGLAALNPRTLAIMHGSSYAGDCVKALEALADDYDRRIADVQTS
jgi:flavorubredoxin